MENKYYVPEIEEFHVGFEYEQDSGYEWVKRVFKDMGGIYNLDNAINQKGLRVKHLDREDIESLGFEENMGQEYYSIKKGDILIGLEVLHPPGLYRIEIGTHMMFFTIKNKSELKKLLSWIM